MLIPGNWFYLCLLIVFTPFVARADLSQSQARKLIHNLTGSSVRVERISSSAEGAEATAEVQLVFRSTQHQGHWRLSEVRTGQDRWESLDFIAKAAGIELPGDECDAPSESAGTADSNDLTTKRARCLVAALCGIALPSDVVRIRDVSPFGFSFGPTDASALITALVEIDFRFARYQRGWQVASVKSGSRDWVDVRGLSATIDEFKRSLATEELSLIAQALESYRRERGFYVPGDKLSVLIDHLSPKYLTRVIRVDPWHRPYDYQGAQHYYVIRSPGPDGKLHTPDDISVDYTRPPANKN